METRANYVLIGAFALAGFLGIFAFFLWFANVQLDRQFAYYDVDFESVSGLSDASDVRFAGLTVGQVVEVRLAPDNTGRVRVRVEVDGSTPVRTDSIATIEAQGVTGVSFVGISAGTPDMPLLMEASEADIPMIEAGRSVLQSLSEDAPAILAETLEAVRDLRELINEDNQVRVQTILENVEQSSEAFSDALDDFAAVSGTVSDFALEIERFNTTLADLSSDASAVLGAAEEAITTFNAASGEARDFIAEGTETFADARSTIAATRNYIDGSLSDTTQQLSSTLAEIETRATRLSDEVSALIGTYEQTGQAASQRLLEAEETLAATDALIARTAAAMENVDAAAARFDSLIEDGADPLIAELRVATSQASDLIGAVRETARDDLPGIIDDLRVAASTVSETVTTLAEDLTSSSGDLDQLISDAAQTLETTRATFANANETLAAINSALETGDSALSAAEAAFIGADRFINEEIGAMSESLSRSLAELERAVGRISTEIPGVTDDLRAASLSARNAFTQLAEAVDQSAPAVNAFATTALPQYGRLAQETRTLIENLDALVEQIRRDPSRFFLDPRAPEFRR